MIVIGIDPGVHGALALVDVEQRRLVDARALPLRLVPPRYRVADYTAVIDFLEGYALGLAVIEAITPRTRADDTRRNSGVSIASSGVIWGSVVAAIVDLGVPVEVLHPTSWKSKLGLVGKPKAAACDVAAATLGEAGWLRDPRRGPAVERVAIAEAALIALVGARRPRPTAHEEAAA